MLFRSLRLRSADEFIPSIRCPIRFMIGEQDIAAQQGLDEFLADAKAAGKSCERVNLPGNHHTSKPEAIARSAAWFAELASKP